MADFRLASPRVRVWRGSMDAPEVLEIQTLNPDLIAWDMTHARHKWPDLKVAPFKWLTFIGWHAARREGLIPADLTYEAWEASTLDVSAIDDEEEDEGAGEESTPSPPGPGPG